MGEKEREREVHGVCCVCRADRFRERLLYDMQNSKLVVGKKRIKKDERDNIRERGGREIERCVVFVVSVALIGFANGDVQNSKLMVG